MVHAVMAGAQPGDVLVLTMPEPEPVALIGDLLATQAKERGVAAMLVDAAVRDLEDLRRARSAGLGALVRVRGADEDGRRRARRAGRGRRDATIRPGDHVVLDDDGAVVVSTSASTRCWPPSPGAPGERAGQARASWRTVRCPTTWTVSRVSRGGAVMPRRGAHRPRRAAHAQAARRACASSSRCSGWRSRRARGSRCSCAAGATTSATASS